MDEKTKPEILLDRYARWSYEKLRLSQPQIETKGLFRRGNQFVIVVPNLSQLKADDGRSLVVWFHDHKAMTSPVVLVDKFESEYVSIPSRTTEELVALSGEPRSLNDVIIELSLRLGSKFPRFTISEFPPDIGEVIVERCLSKSEEKLLRDSLDDLQIPLKWEITVGKFSDVPTKYFEGNISIITANDGRLHNASTKLRELIQRDDELWLSQGRSVLAGTKIEDLSESSFYQSLRSEDTSLVNATVFRPDDIRNHLTLFGTTNIMLPLHTFENEALNGFGISELELVELVSIGKLRILLPQSTHRYSMPLLNKLIDANPKSIVFPHTLATLAVDKVRDQFPYLFPPGTVDERAEYLKGLLLLQEKMPVGFFRNPIDALIEFHKKYWPTFEYVYNLRGSMALQSHGVGAYISEIFKTLSGQDQFIEFGHADMGVSLSAALRATYFPTEGTGWSDKGHSAILANVYHRGFGTFVLDFQKRMDTVLDGILSIRKDVPVVELAKAMGGGDIVRLRKHVFEIAHQPNLNIEELRLSVEKINKEVKNIESSNDRLSRWDMLGVISGIAGATATDDPVKGLIIGAVTKGMLAELPAIKAKYPAVGAAFDSLECIWRKTSPDRILFARIKQALKER